MQHAREKRLRRAAERQGLKVQKSRRRKPGAHGHGMYWLVDPWLNAVAAGGDEGMTIDELEAYLVQANRNLLDP